MPDETRCAICGARIPAEAPEGQCIPCLLNLALPQIVRYVGDYELIEEIAPGGMGVVYRARQVSLNRLVALKLLTAGSFATKAERDRFHAEAEAAARLDHPHIVPVYEVGEHEGRPYLAMKLIEGPDLNRRLAEGEFDFAPDGTSAGRARARTIQLRMATLLAQVARAVHFAHQHQVLHRDLKPSNLLVDEHDHPWVADFGLAKSLDDTTPRTRTGAILGTAEYMSPEQARGEKHLSTASDLFSLGSILYHLHTGHPPFQGESFTATLRLVIEAEPVRPSTVNPQADRDLETICLQCLEKDPARRYDSAAALADELERWLRGEPIRARPIGPVERVLKWIRRKPLKAALWGVGLLAVIGPLVVAGIYVTMLPYLIGRHRTVYADDQGVFLLRVAGRKGDRWTDNFEKRLFAGGRQASVHFTNVPPELLAMLTFRICSDVPALPDPARTGVLTNGSVFRLDPGTRWEVDYYVAGINPRAEEVLRRAPQAVVRIVLLPIR
jgi:serine/threonine-protein kinase